MLRFSVSGHLTQFRVYQHVYESYYAPGRSVYAASA